MFISKIKIENWKNFKSVDVHLSHRVFITGPNASGKSNLIDVIRFLRDISKSGGGLQEAVRNRGGVSKIRCLAAKGRNSDIGISIDLSDDDKKFKWRYEIGFTQTGGGILDTRAKIRYERVWNEKEELILDRPNQDDKGDEKLLEYTHLEQPTSNSKFRDIAEFLAGVQYLHILPQLVRDPGSYLRASNEEDFFGRDFIERINKSNQKSRKAFLKRIEKALTLAVPQFEQLELVTDEMGVPHLQAKYKHWRASGAKQREDQFSDGTIRLIGFLWSMLEGTKTLLLEEPELSLHPGIVSKLAEIISQLQMRKSVTRQVIITTHSYDLLSNKGISGEETLLLLPSEEGTVVTIAANKAEIKQLLLAGVSVADAVLPYTTPKNIPQLSLFEFD